MYKTFRLGGFLSSLILFFGLPLESVAQEAYQKGYVVTRANDTLRGLVKDRKTGAFGKLYKKIKFKGKRAKSKYAPKEITAYKKGNTTYESMALRPTGHFFETSYVVSVDGDFQFLKVIEKGHLSYYHLEHEDADSGHIENTAFFKKKDGDVLVRVNQGIFGLKRKKLAAYFSDCPELAQNILNKRINRPMEIVRFYNHWKATSG